MKLKTLNISAFVAVGSCILVVLAGFVDNAPFYIMVQRELKTNYYTTNN